MLCEKQLPTRNCQLTLKAKRERILVRWREQQLENMFRTFRNTILTSNFELPLPQSPLLVQHPVFLPPAYPLNLPLLQQHFMRFIPPQIQMPQPAITEQKVIRIQQNNQRQIRPPKSEQIYFQKQNFRIFKKLIGEGTFSKVWLGVDLLKNQQIAAKEVKKLEQSEARCLKGFDSPNIIKVFEIIRHRNSTFIILQFCSRNLRQEMVECKYDLSKCLNYFQQIVVGMNQLQSNNIIHRDLKFQNILLKKEIVKIADFGLAKFLGDQLQIQSRRCGSPYTMAPEVYFADYSASYTSKCDIWSLGVILHEMLYKSHPFGKSNQNFKNGKRLKIKKKFGVLDQLIDRCLVQNPTRRADWKEFLNIYEKYFLNRNRYFFVDILPIDVESVVYEEKSKIIKKQNIVCESFDNFDLNGIRQQIEQNKRRQERQERQRIQKMINDFDVYDGIQAMKMEKKKEEKRQNIRKPKHKIQQDKRPERYHKNQLKVQRNMASSRYIEFYKKQESNHYKPLSLKQNFEIEKMNENVSSKQKIYKQSDKKQEEKPQIRHIKLPRNEQQPSSTQMVIIRQLITLGVVTALIIYLVLLR